MLRRIALLVGFVLLLSSCGFYPFPVSPLRTDILVREGDLGVEMLFCPEAEVAEVRIAARDQEADGAWGEYRVVVDENALGWNTGPESPTVMPGDKLANLRAPVQLSVLVTGSRAGEDVYGSTLIEISPEMDAAVSSGSWINADGPTEEPCT